MALLPLRLKPYAPYVEVPMAIIHWAAALNVRLYLRYAPGEGPALHNYSPETGRLQIFMNLAHPDFEKEAFAALIAFHHIGQDRRTPLPDRRPAEPELLCHLEYVSSMMRAMEHSRN